MIDLYIGIIITWIAGIIGLKLTFKLVVKFIEENVG